MKKERITPQRFAVEDEDYLPYLWYELEEIVDPYENNDKDFCSVLVPKKKDAKNGLVIYSKQKNDSVERLLACRFKGGFLKECPQILLEHWYDGFYKGWNSISLINITKNGLVDNVDLKNMDLITSLFRIVIEHPKFEIAKIWNKIQEKILTESEAMRIWDKKFRL